MNVGEKCVLKLVAFDHILIVLIFEYILITFIYTMHNFILYNSC